MASRITLDEASEVIVLSMRDAFLAVTVFVAVMVLLFSWLQYVTAGKFVDWIRQNKTIQPLIGAIMGLTPGCGGAIIVMPMYTRGYVTYGTVIATLIATTLCVYADDIAMDWEELESIGVIFEYPLYNISLLIILSQILLEIFLLLRTYKSSMTPTRAYAMLKRSKVYFSSTYHPTLSADVTSVKKFVRGYLTSVIFNWLDIVFGLLVSIAARTTLLIIQFVSTTQDQRLYISSVLLIVIWLDYYEKINQLTVISPSFTKSHLVNQKCILAILEIMSVAALLGIPFLLVILKISVMEGFTINEDTTGDSDSPAQYPRRLFYSGVHIYRMLTLDDFHDQNFEELHLYFLTLFYTIGMSIFSIVFLNMCIAKLSIEYVKIMDSAEFQLKRRRLIVRIYWPVDKIKANNGVLKEKMKSGMKRVMPCFF